MIQKFILTNGLKVIIEPIPTVRSIAIGIWVGNGSRHETVSNNGISHFIEHMLFKGTKNRSAREIAEAFDSIGGIINAFTSKEYTCYYTKLLDEHVEMGISLLSDMFFNSKFDQQELDMEKNVVLEEIKMNEDAPDDQIHDLIANVSFKGDSLGFPILGSETVLNSLTRDDIVNFVKNKYTVNNSVITLAGNTPDNIIELIETYFEPFGNYGPENNIGNVNFNFGEMIKTKQTEQAHLAIALPGLAISDPNIYSLILLNNIIGGTMSSRLFQEIREKRGLAYSVFSYHSSYRDTGLFTIYAGTAPKQVNEVVDIINNTLLDIKNSGINQNEITKAKEQLKGSLMLSLESTNNRMNRLGKNELLIGKHLTLDEIITKINNVNYQSILEITDKLFSYPYSFSMISPLEQTPNSLRRDVLVSN
ncbi:MAG: M16 family metallopeptidase [Vulcanibacillus sp.]